MQVYVQIFTKIKTGLLLYCIYHGTESRGASPPGTWKMTIEDADGPSMSIPSTWHDKLERCDAQTITKTIKVSHGSRRRMHDYDDG